MVTNEFIPDIAFTPPNVIATGVSFDEYMEKYAEHFCELVGDTVIKMSPIHERHDELSRYYAMLLAAYFSLNPIGRIRQAPFVQILTADLPKREPDVMVILDSNPHQLAPTFMDGAADICIEIASLSTIDTDRGAKFREYEAGGVREYWFSDPLHFEALFYRRNAKGKFEPQQTDAEGNYRTPLLPGLVMHVPTLWRSPLPDILTIVESVKKMLGE